MDLFFTLLIDFGLPVAASAVMGIFIYIILKYILGSVIGQVQGMHGIIMGLDKIRFADISCPKTSTR